MCTGIQQGSYHLLTANRDPVLQPVAPQLLHNLNSQHALKAKAWGAKDWRPLLHSDVQLGLGHIGAVLLYLL